MIARHPFLAGVAATLTAGLLAGAAAGAFASRSRSSEAMSAHKERGH